MSIYELIPIVGIPLGRAILGWLENALEDKKITKLEWTQLGGTVLRVGIPAVILWLGLRMDPTAAASITAVLDIFVHKVASKHS